MASLYDDLGIAPDADDAEIKAAHRKAVRKNHPDIGGKREDFERVQRAYLILSDQQRREKYDRTGDADESAIDRTFSLISEKIIYAFDAAILKNAHVLASCDVIAAARKIINDEKTSVATSVHNAAVDRKGVEGIIKRLKFKGDGPDPIWHST
jgi:curved DNA-binding protein CbpA